MNFKESQAKLRGELFELIRTELAASPSRTYVEIAAGLGTTPGTVIQVAKLYGLTRRRGPKPRVMQEVVNGRQ